jgi:ankyrin repeat protein
MNHRDREFQETPVYKAILTNNFQLVKLFISEGSNMSIRNVFGNDVLSRSIQLGRFKIARLLIAADSPIRVYSCFYKIPSVDEYKHFNNDELMSTQYGDDETEQYNIDLNEYNQTRDNFLQYSIGKYEEFLEFLKKYTQQPRRLVDLSRLCVRNHMKKPISKYINHLGSLPPSIADLLILKDIEQMI